MNTERYTLNTLQKKSLEKAIVVSYDTLSTVKAIGQNAIQAVKHCMSIASDVFPVEYKRVFVGYALSYGLKKAMLEGFIAVRQGLRMYVLVKKAMSEKNGDKGYFGDILEVLIRCAFVGNIALIRPEMIHVKEQSQTDIISKKYGKIEVGHNGKTFTQGTIFDYMEGDFSSVVYGVFDEEQKDYIIELIKKNDIIGAFKNVCAYCGYWQDKYDFLRDINGLSTGKGITIKAGQVMVQYNAGKHKVFIKALENGTIKCLADILKIK